MRYRQLCIALLICLSWINSGSGIERKRDQFTRSNNYLVAPAPYSIPGIGSGILVVAYAGDIMDTYADLFASQVFGDIEGLFFAARDFHLIDERLYFEMFSGDISKAATTSYKQRGMESEGDEYNILESNDIRFQGGAGILSFYDRMLEFSLQYATGGATFNRILDQDGNVIADNSDQETTFSRYLATIDIDYTDDKQDPRKGIRLEISYENTGFESQSDSSPEQYLVDYNLTFYLPVFDFSTFAFNYFQSDAFVTQEGETDLAVIESELGIDCTSSSNQSECEDAKQSLIQNTFAANKYGTASNLGGAMRLRGYPQNRFRAAHHRFFGAEFRWNLSDENSPFDLFFIKDIRTGTQLAFFYETATSADLEEDLGDEWRSDYGFGFRLITRSGFVYRFDIARGSEGTQLAAFFNYPWEGF